MGFDNDCIINIESLAGDYFCPVCRLLVLPNEALQSQCCTHLYCKPCFTYVVSTKRACPYDGYLLTEANSKPLIESNKTLAETIGKIAVYCLYRKSGCSWQGILSECMSHCKGCSFGNYPVVCNRCGLQILHRQVEEHAQTCSGMVQPGAVTQDPSATSATAVASIDQNQVAAPVAVIALQPVTSQTVVATTAAGHVANLLPNPTSQTQALCQTAVQPTAEQWYQQQQYQQYNIQHSSMQHSAPVDRISNLPDEILSHIISFLPTKQAFTTTLLSKRWTSLCYSLTDLRFEFDDETVPDGDNDAINRFCRFVDTVMLSPRATNQPIKTFGLNCRSRIHDVDRQSLEAWVEAAKQRSVKEFYLFFSNVTLNPTIFTSHTLVVLKLAMLQLKAENLCVHLPSLKTLYLKFVRFEKQNDFIKLLNACPNLQDLQTSDLRYMRRDEKNEAEEFKSLFLSKLVRADIGSIDVPFNVVPNVKFLRLIREPSLQMNVEDIFKVIPVFKNLIHIELWFYGFFHGWDGAVELLQHCPKLQILFMIKWSSSLCKDWDSPISGLECASSHLRSCTILNFEGSKNDIGFAKYILENARLLQYMTIDVATRSSNGMQKDQIIEELSSCPRMSPGCKLSFQFVK